MCIPQKDSNQPIFALTMGDPAGIGPEIAIKALLSPPHSMRVIIIGDLAVLRWTAANLGLSPVFASIDSPATYQDDAINVLDLKLITPEEYSIGISQANCGKAAYQYILRAIDLAMEHQVAGVITNPINKESLKKGGIDFPGHTEIFAAKTGVTDFSMLFLLNHIGVAHVTTHCSLRNAIELIREPRVVSQIRLLNKAMHRLGIERPRIAVSGLNPHAGENGLFGTEEIEHITPAINKAKQEGIDVSGPYPPDTVFMRAFKGQFDGVVSMLHDHGFVALKSLDFEHGVNITIGLPIIRTSVGHGTAFDLAGTGKASTESLKSALDTARLLYQNREL